MKNYKIKGIELDENEMCMIVEYYETHCTAEYIQDTYGFDYDKSVELAKRVRDFVNYRGLTEEDAVHIVCNQDVA